LPYNSDNTFEFQQRELGSTFISFYVSKSYLAEADIEFTKLIVNQKPIMTYNPRTIPGDQGYYILVGLFENGTTLDIAWEIETGFVSGQQSSSVGVFRSFNLRNSTEIDQIDIETFETYSGIGTVIV